MRTYSLSDSPDRDYYRVSIKREPPPRDQPGVAPGLSSTYFHDQVEEGMSLQVGAPRGKFQRAGHVLLVNFREAHCFGLSARCAILEISLNTAYGV